jgi:hypothetical protein
MLSHARRAGPDDEDWSLIKKVNFMMRHKNGAEEDA